MEGRKSHAALMGTYALEGSPARNYDGVMGETPHIPG